MGGLGYNCLPSRFCSSSQSKVLKLSCPGDKIQSCQWEEMEEKLKVPRYHHVSINVPNSSNICKGFGINSNRELRKQEVPTTTTSTTTTTTLTTTVPKILVMSSIKTFVEIGTTTKIWSQPKAHCALPNFPYRVVGSVGFWTAQGPTVCGGYRDRTGYLVKSDKRCFYLNQKHQWMPWTTMITERQYASFVQIDSNKTLIIGGYNSKIFNALKTSELISSSGSQYGKDFPVTISKHCIIKINSTHGLITGGSQDRKYSASTWFVDLATTTFTPGPTMKMKRAMHGCAAVHLGSKTYGIVSGGYYYKYYRNVQLYSTEMIDLDQHSPAWIEGMLERGKNSFALDNY